VLVYGAFILSKFINANPTSFKQQINEGTCVQIEQPLQYSKRAIPVSQIEDMIYKSSRRFTNRTKTLQTEQTPMIPCGGAVYPLAHLDSSAWLIFYFKSSLTASFAFGINKYPWRPLNLSSRRPISYQNELSYRVHMIRGETLNYVIVAMESS